MIFNKLRKLFLMFGCAYIGIILATIIVLKGGVPEWGWAFNLVISLILAAIFSIAVLVLLRLAAIKVECVFRHKFLFPYIILSSAISFMVLEIMADKSLYWVSGFSVMVATTFLYTFLVKKFPQRI